MCNCIEEIKEKLLARYRKDSTAKNPEVQSIDFAHEALMFGGKPVAFPVGIPVEIMSTFEKVNGERSRSTKKEVSMFATYCPFCGLDRDGLPASGDSESPEVPFPALGDTKPWPEHPPRK